MLDGGGHEEKRDSDPVMRRFRNALLIVIAGDIAISFTLAVRREGTFSAGFQWFVSDGGYIFGILGCVLFSVVYSFINRKRRHSSGD